MLPSERGGRRAPISSGYRCNCWIGSIEDGERRYNDATFYLLDVDRLGPGERGRVRVEPHLPEAWSNLAKGLRIELCEGRRVVGIATVTRLDVD